MRRKRLLTILLTSIFPAAAGLEAQTPPHIGIRVSETAGIRRTAFPVNAHVPFPRSALRGPEAARLMLNGKEVPAQYGTETRWPDGSVASLAVDFNANVGPGESLDYQLEYGEGIRAAESPRGLSVNGGPEAIQSGNIRFNRSGSPLIESVKYRGEEIGHGSNGLFVTDEAGKRYDLSNADAIETEVVKSGPLYVVIRYSGNIVIDADYRVPFTLTAEMPTSKTMVKLSALVEDPAKRLRGIAIETPLAFAAMPLVWDFGTSRWTYGSMRAATDSVTLTQTSNDWSVQTGSGGKEQLYETAGKSAPGPVRWGHLQDGKEVVALAFEGAEDGTWRVKLDGTGQTSFGYTPLSPATGYRISVYEHFVTAPVQIGAATSPAALLSPLSVSIQN
jgi:hypothetical protein